MRSRRSARIRLYAVRTLSILLLSGITFLFARGALRMYSRYGEASVARAGAESELKSLTAREKELLYQTKRLSSDRGMEEELRRRYGVVLPGEGVIEIVSATNTAASAQPGHGFIDWFKRLF